MAGEGRASPRRRGLELLLRAGCRGSSVLLRAAGDSAEAAAPSRLERGQPHVAPGDSQGAGFRQSVQPPVPSRESIQNSTSGQPAARLHTRDGVEPPGRVCSETKQQQGALQALAAVGCRFAAQAIAGLSPKPGRSDGPHDGPAPRRAGLRALAAVGCGYAVQTLEALSKGGAPPAAVVAQTGRRVAAGAPCAAAVPRGPGEGSGAGAVPTIRSTSGTNSCEATRGQRAAGDASPCWPALQALAAVGCRYAAQALSSAAAVPPSKGDAPPAAVVAQTGRRLGAGDDCAAVPRPQHTFDSSGEGSGAVRSTSGNKSCGERASPRWAALRALAAVGCRFAAQFFGDLGAETACVISYGERMPHESRGGRNVSVQSALPALAAVGCRFAAQFVSSPSSVECNAFAVVASPTQTAENARSPEQRRQPPTVPDPQRRSGVAMLLDSVHGGSPTPILQTLHNLGLHDAATARAVDYPLVDPTDHLLEKRPETACSEISTSSTSTRVAAPALFALRCEFLNSQVFLPSTTLQGLEILASTGDSPPAAGGGAPAENVFTQTARLLIRSSDGGLNALCLAAKPASRAAAAGPAAALRGLPQGTDRAEVCEGGAAEQKKKKKKKEKKNPNDCSARSKKRDRPAGKDAADEARSCGVESSGGGGSTDGECDGGDAATEARVLAGEPIAFSPGDRGRLPAGQRRAVRLLPPIEEARNKALRRLRTRRCEAKNNIGSPPPSPPATLADSGLLLKSRKEAHARCVAFLRKQSDTRLDVADALRHAEQARQVEEDRLFEQKKLMRKEICNRFTAARFGPAKGDEEAPDLRKEIEARRTFWPALLPTSMPNRMEIVRELFRSTRILEKQCALETKKKASSKQHRLPAMKCVLLSSERETTGCGTCV
ncbi:hypothetical protein DIPPA_35026, partial [Diplonema papillatum]